MHILVQKVANIKLLYFWRLWQHNRPTPETNLISRQRQVRLSSRCGNGVYTPDKHCFICSYSALVCTAVLSTTDDAILHNKLPAFQKRRVFPYKISFHLKLQILVTNTLGRICSISQTFSQEDRKNPGISFGQASNNRIGCNQSWKPCDGCCTPVSNVNRSLVSAGTRLTSSTSL